MSRKPKNVDEPFSPEQLAQLEKKGEKDVQLQRQKEGLFQRYHARRDAKDLASQVRWKRRAGVALVVLVLVLLFLFARYLLPYFVDVPWGPDPITGTNN